MELADAKFDIEYDGEPFTIKESGVDLFGNIWKPAGEPKFVYVFLHGMGAFITFKKDFFYLILERQGVVFGCDHLGHGKSQGKRTSSTVAEVVDATVQVVNLAKQRYPNLPIVIHGHSFGGLSSLMTVYTRYNDIKENLKCVIVEAPWISKCPQRELNRVEQYGVRFLGKVIPNMGIGVGVDLFSPDLDKRWVDLVRDDPLYSHKVTPRLFVSALDAQQYIRDNIANWPKELPLLFLMGKADALVDPADNEKWVTDLQKVDGVQVTYKSYENVPHVMLKCPYRATIIKDMFEFMDKYLK